MYETFYCLMNYDMEVNRIMSIDVYEQIPVMEIDKFRALEHMGFCLSKEAVIGHDGTKYGSYYVREV